MPNGAPVPGSGTWTGWRRPGSRRPRSPWPPCSRPPWTPCWTPWPAGTSWTRAP
nr:MAG TPA: hypothetical protein [Caudoviricetes sp.]